MAEVRSARSSAGQLNATGTGESRRQKLHFSHFLVLTCAALIFGSVLLNLAALIVLPTRGDTMYPETANVLPGMALLRTGHVYPDFNQAPFFASVYGPLFYFCIAAFARVFNSDLYAVLVSGRVLSYGCFVATGLIAYLIARRLGHPRKYAAAAWLGIAFCADFFSWNVTFRPDVPAIMLGLAAIYFALRGRAESGLCVVGAGLCAAAAVLLKQSVFMAAMAITIWLVTSKRVREAALFVASAAIPVVLVFGVLQLREPAVQRVMALRYAPHDLASAVVIVQHAIFRADGVLLMVFAVIGIAAGIRNRRDHRLLVIYFLCSWTLPLFLMIQRGGNANYLLEGWAACALLVPSALASVEARWPRLHVLWRCALVLMLVAVLSGQTGLWKYFTSRRQPQRFAKVALLRDLKVFGDLPYLTGSGRDPELPEPFLGHMLSMTGHWSPAPVAARVDARMYDVIFLGDDRGFARGWRGVTNVDPVLLERINTDYTVLCGTDQTVVLVPNVRAVTFDSAVASQVLGQPCTPRGSGELSSVLKFEPYRSR